MTERTLRVSARLAEEIRQWASDELGRWPQDTAYAADLESLLAQIGAVDVNESRFYEHQRGLSVTDERQMSVSDQPAPDAVAEAAKVLLAVLEDPDSLPIDKHPNWQEVYDEMTADHFESIDICGRHDWPSTLTVALRALSKGPSA